MRVSARFLIWTLMLALVGCGVPAGSGRSGTKDPSASASMRSGMPSPAATLRPAVTQLSAIGRRLAFVAEDDTVLLGEFFPSRVKNAPTVILMHQLGANRRAWVNIGIVDWLVNPLNPEDHISMRPMNWAPLPESDSYSVFIFDFRGHGESRGSAKERSEYLMDARAALAAVRTLKEVDPQQIALIGTSIGGDAAVDVCEDCSGALAISPGSFLGVGFAERAAALGQAGIPAWCVAGGKDGPSDQACLSASGLTFRSLIYPDEAAHGFDLFVDGLEPEITTVLKDFLDETFDL